MNSDQKNLLYFLTGRVKSHIRRSLEIGGNQAGCDVLFNRFRSDHYVLRNEKCPVLSDEIKTSMKEQCTLIDGTLEDVKDHVHTVDLVTMDNTARYFVDYDQLEDSANSLVNGIVSLRPSYVAVLEHKDSELVTKDILEKLFTEKGYGVVSYGFIEKRATKQDKGKKRIFAGYLFYKERGKK